MFRTTQTKPDPYIETSDEENTEHMPGGEDMGGVDVEMPDMEHVSEVIVAPDGTVTTDLDEMADPMLESIPFGANLAEVLNEEELDELGSTIKEYVEADKETRKEWYETLKKGFQALGIYNADDTSETGLRRVTHPLLLEAATQFQARAMAELLPPGGPVKCNIVGEQTPETLAQAGRIQDHMNYQLTIEDRTYYDERDQMLFLLAFTGSEFDKQYPDPTSGKVVSRWVRSDHFIVPYDAKDLKTASRYTHEIHMSHNAYRRAVVAGVYTDCCMDLLPSDDNDAPLTETITELGGQEPGSPRDEDAEHVFYECHIDIDLPGYEEDIALPFIITVDADSGKVLSIYRNWKEDDEYKLRRVWFTHKKFLPGFGFYGFGLLHCIGNLGESATEILRILLDSGAFATLQGGFKSKDARMKGDVELEPGVWQDTEMTADELSRAFYTPPFKEPSQVLNALLGTIVEAGQKFAATTETMTGDAATTGPVGTMVAQIEQGSKVFSGIHKRLHKAFGDEFLHIAELNGEYLPEAYPFRVAGADKAVLKTDYDGRIDVVPVSDPNIFSTAQRLAMAQTAMQLATSMPDLADRREAAINLLEAMRFPNPTRIFPKKAEAARLDPISEMVSMLQGRPIKAYLEQNHMAHNQTHQGQMQQLPQQYQPLMLAHIMEHESMSLYLTAQQQGVPLPPANWGAEPADPMFPTLPPEMENQIAMQAAQNMQQFMQQQQAAQQQQQQQQQQRAAQPDPQQQAAAFQQEQQMKDMAFQKEQQRKDAALAAEVDRKDAMEGLSPTLVKQATEFVAQTGIQMSPRELALLSKVLGKDFSATVQAVSRMLMAGQGGGPAPIAQAGVNQGQARFM